MGAPTSQLVTCMSLHYIPNKRCMLIIWNRSTDDTVKYRYMLTLYLTYTHNSRNMIYRLIHSTWHIASRDWFKNRTAHCTRPSGAFAAHTRFALTQMRTNTPISEKIGGAFALAGIMRQWTLAHLVRFFSICQYARSIRIRAFAIDDSIGKCIFNMVVLWLEENWAMSGTVRSYC